MEEKVFTERVRASLFNHLTDRIMKAGAPDNIDVLADKVLKDVEAGPVAEIPIEALHPEIDEGTKKDVLFFVGVAVKEIAPIIGKCYAGKMKVRGIEYLKALNTAERKIIDSVEEPQ